MNLKFDLNNEQRKAVLHKDGPALVLSGAGSGKTRVITYRIANLIKEGVDPSEILTVTFTNKAADEMTRRVKELMGKDMPEMWIGTFHSCCLRILREHLDEIGYKPNYLIYDTEDSLSVIRDALVFLNLDENAYDPKIVFRMITDAKMNLVPYNRYFDWLPDDKKTNFHRNVAEIYREYNKRLRHNNAFDFTDLITKTIDLFRMYPEILEKYQKRFRYIQCDEYQDTNYSQYLILNMLAKPENNLFVVGDFDQSIYKFRGADIRNILDFEKDYKDATIIKLERNYRSSGNIVKASNALIENNKNRKEKVSYTDAKPGYPIIVCEAEDPQCEAEFVAKTIYTMVRNEECDYKDIAILYRSNYQSQPFETKFIQMGIPYHIVNGVGFFNRKEIKDFLAFLRLAVNINDSPSLTRIISLENNDVGPVTVSKLLEYSFVNEIPLIDVLSNPTVVEGVGEVRGKAILRFKEQVIDPIMRIANEEDMDLQEKILGIFHEVNYEEILIRDKNTYENRMENIEAFFEFVNDYCRRNGSDGTIADFLQNIKLVSDQDSIDEEENKVKLMTVHASKGLEFPVVFVVGMEEETFPHRLSMETEEDIEEERRLAYVAMTRAKRRLFLSYCKVRFYFYDFIPKTISRFIYEIPDKYTKKLVFQTSESKAI